MNKTLKEIEKFHGHLGPYAVLGYKMGLIAKEKLGSDPFIKKAIVYTGTTPPISCIVDGIQLGSSCTLGKGNLKTVEKNQAKAEFFLKDNPNNKITISLKPDIKSEIDSTITKENIISYSELIWKKPDDELFDFL